MNDLYRQFFSLYHRVIRQVCAADFVPLLALRWYLAPIFIVAGLNKLAHFDNTVAWFGNAEWGLGLPMPAVLAGLAIFAEVVGGFALMLGWFTRLFSVMLAVTMVVAALAVHLKNGWFAIAPSDPSSNMASLFAPLGWDSAKDSLTQSGHVAERLQRARSILQEHGNYDWLTETGNFVVLNNGVEFAVTYLIMLSVLVFYGAGRWVSIDYWLTPRTFRGNK